MAVHCMLYDVVPSWRPNILVEECNANSGLQVCCCWRWCQVIGDSWQVTNDRWQVTHDRWNVTRVIKIKLWNDWCYYVYKWKNSVYPVCGMFCSIIKPLRLSLTLVTKLNFNDLICSEGMAICGELLEGYIMQRGGVITWRLCSLSSTLQCITHPSFLL